MPCRKGTHGRSPHDPSGVDETSRDVCSAADVLSARSRQPNRAPERSEAPARRNPLPRRVRRPRLRPRPPHLPLRRRHAAASGDSRPLRLRQDRGGLRLQVRVLHHPEDARPLSQPHDRLGGRRRRARSRPGAFSELLLISQDTTFYGIDRKERGALPRLLRALERGRRHRVGPPALSLPDDHHRRRHRRHRRARQGVQVHRPAAAARVRPGAEADEAPRHARRPTSGSSPASARVSPTSPSAPPSSSASRARPSRLRGARGVRRRRGVRPRRGLHLLARGRHLGLRPDGRRAGGR